MMLSCSVTIVAVNLGAIARRAGALYQSPIGARAVADLDSSEVSGLHGVVDGSGPALVLSDQHAALIAARETW